jgi:peptidoglycan/xylan/chitin deacetylase (PgdA/CDA1 family)
MRLRLPRRFAVVVALSALLALSLQGCLSDPESAPIGDRPPTVPTTDISCNNTECGTTADQPSQVNITLTAAGGIEPLTTRYTTDGTDPTTSPTADTYTAAFNIAVSRTIRYYTFDSAGTAERPKTQRIAVDAGSVNTVVSLTFDDGLASHAATGPLLASRGMVGTYYINSAQVGTSGYYMTWQQIHALADAGHEIGGHTLHHVNLANVDGATAETEVCQDRQNLLDQGFSPVNSFAYPEAAVDATAKQVVRQCGYVSGRSVGKTYSAGACDSCPYAETIPPADPYELKTPKDADSHTTLSQLQSYVTDAEANGGGWIILSFHGVCSDKCTGESSYSPATFTAFLDWLQPRTANGTIVQTVGQVIGSSRSLP